jgi:hypothetical protein
VGQLSNRWAALTGVLSVACSFIGVMLVLGQPQDKDSDAKIVAYFADHWHRVQSVVGFFVFLAGIVLLLGFLFVLRDRLRTVEGDRGRLSGLAFAAGVASLPFWGVSMILANATAFAADNTSAFRVDPNTFRVLSDGAYFAWVAAVVVSSVVVWSTSAIALRMGVLPRWYGVAGIVAGVVQLFAYFFFPFFIWWAWIIVTSVLLVSRRSTVAASVAQPAL